MVSISNGEFWSTILYNGNEREILGLVVQELTAVNHTSDHNMLTKLPCELVKTYTKA